MTAPPLARARAALMLVVFACALLVMPAAGAQTNIALVFPKTEAPYNRVFSGVLQGIENVVSDGSLATFELRPENRVLLEPWLAKHSPIVTIRLGRAAVETFQNGRFASTQLIGAVDSPLAKKTGLPGIALSPDPEYVFDTLRDTAPDVRRIWVVCNKARDGWIIERARVAARARGLHLEVRNATDLRSAAKAYLAVFEDAKPQTDSIWLLEDTNLISNRDTLPFLVKESWKRRVPIFSNTLLHARQGVLFAVYLDPEALGERLAGRALGIVAGKPSGGLTPLASLRRAINRRVASHLDLSIDPRTFDLVFPQR